MSTKRTLIAGLAAAALATGLVAQATAPAAAHPIIILPPHPYHHHHHGGWGGPVALGAGFVLGAAMASAAAEGPGYEGIHIRRCESRFPSYDPETDTFIGYDGRAHYCRL
jgi:hypothetical protein